MLNFEVIFVSLRKCEYTLIANLSRTEYREITGRYSRVVSQCGLASSCIPINYQT